MSFRTRDARYGPNCYAPVWKWDEDQYVYSALVLEEDRIEDLFEHIYFEFTYLDSSGEKHKTYEDCGISTADIYDSFYQLYQERLIAFPYYFNGGDGQTNSVNRIRDAVKSVLDLNYWKYKKMVQTLGLVYDPIENYNMTESGTDTDTPSGTSTKEHSVNATQVGSITVEGKVSALTIDSPTTQDPNFKIASRTIDKDGRTVTNTTATSDNRNGWVANRGQPPSTGVYGTPQETNGGQTGSETVVTRNYVTTMDDATTGRLHNYTEGQGTTSQGLYSDVVTDYPATAKITAGNPAFASYTDTESFDDRVDTKEHELSRSGNIGVTTSQQMIEQERKLVEFSVVKEFFKDLEHALFLSVWY